MSSVLQNPWVAESMLSVARLDRNILDLGSRMLKVFAF